LVVFRSQSEKRPTKEEKVPLRKRYVEHRVICASDRM
jgi:hypothetical protein